MQKRDFDALSALEKRIYAKLNEVMGITRELAEAVNRQDRVAVQMLLSTRQQPVLELQDLRAEAALKRCDLSGESERQFDRLFAGEEMDTPEEQALSAQLAANRRLLKRVVELDRTVSAQLCRRKSYYRTHEKTIMSRDGT